MGHCFRIYFNGRINAEIGKDIPEKDIWLMSFLYLSQSDVFAV